MYIEVAVPTPLFQTFTYRSDEAVRPGSRVLVSFGTRKVVGVALGNVDRIEASFEAKDIEKIVDTQPLLSTSLLDLGRWMSRYYQAPIGEVFKSMLPGSSKVKKKQVLSLKDPEVRNQSPRSKAAQEHWQLLCQIFSKKSELGRPVVLRKLKDLGCEDPKSEISAWSRRSWVQWQSTKDVQAREATIFEACNQSDQAEPAKILQPQQAEVFNKLSQGLLERQQPDTMPQLLWGVTGAGKTEIYLQLIERLLNSPQHVDAQVLVLVPEISLTPQMTAIFSARFPGQVAVIHSAMSDELRWQVIQSVHQGQVRLLIGPRSAVFAPFAHLKLIVVDEEHDGSYKQSTGLCYQGRDVAVMRARMENAMIVLGSATPSLESYANALSGKYALHRLDKRISQHGMPAVEVIECKPSFAQGLRLTEHGIPNEDQLDPSSIVHPKVVEALKENYQQGQQSMVLVNRRGFAFYLFDLEQREAVGCPSCAISLTLHNRSKILRCHYCDYQSSLDKLKRDHPRRSYVAVGYGSQRVEDVLKAALHPAKIARLDSDTSLDRDHLSSTLDRFRQGKIDVLVGTQMLAKGHDFPKVTLIVLLEVDQMLNLPDFRAAERSFQLLVQASGRAGRAELAGRVMIQSSKIDIPIVKWALQHDYQSFVDHELPFRGTHGFPPHARMVAIEISSTDIKVLSQATSVMEDWIDRWLERMPPSKVPVKVTGPLPPPIALLRNRHRRMVVATAKDVQGLHHFVMSFRTAFAKHHPMLRLKVDVDPQSLI